MSTPSCRAASVGLDCRVSTYSTVSCSALMSNSSLESTWLVNSRARSHSFICVMMSAFCDSAGRYQLYITVTRSSISSALGNSPFISQYRAAPVSASSSLRGPDRPAASARSNLSIEFVTASADVSVDDVMSTQPCSASAGAFSELVASTLRSSERARSVWPTCQQNAAASSSAPSLARSSAAGIMASSDPTSPRSGSSDWLW
mmetsp:Transcript_17017/g.59590  ORF Transcript_17017/g.59590 Transcript_17017/m.59590 type:complete len:203 (-) Transcript_17017:432-1040(-)